MTFPRPDDLFNEQPVFRVGFTYGHQRADGQPVEPALLDQAARYLTRTLCDVCGGARVNSDPGAYRHANGSVVQEGSTTVWAFGMGSDIPVAQLIRAGRSVGQQLDQEAVMLTLERVPGAIVFIRPDDTDEVMSDRSDITNPDGADDVTPSSPGIP